MKTIGAIFIVILLTSQQPKDTYKPYLVENNKISSSSIMSLNKDSSETDIDTIFCRVEIIDMNSGVEVRSKITGLIYHPAFYIKAYGLWVYDPYMGNHWDLFDERFRMLKKIPGGITVGKIIELYGKKKTK